MFPFSKSSLIYLVKDAYHNHKMIYIYIKYFIYLRKPVCSAVFVKAPVTMSKQFSGVPYEKFKRSFCKNKVRKYEIIVKVLENIGISE